MTPNRIQQSYHVQPAGYDDSQGDESAVTFQIAMVGCDGLVIGSDRLGRYGGTSAPMQTLSQKKYFISPSGSLICFAAGGPTAVELARKISRDYDSLNLKTDSDWHDAIYRAAASSPGSDRPSGDDEVLVAQRDVCDHFWMVLRRPGTIPFPTVLQQQRVCTGCKTAALFLPHHLWREDRPVAELKKLALLTLAYAAQEDPSNVGPPFDIVTLVSGSPIKEETYNVTHESFQSGLELLFSSYDG